MNWKKNPILTSLAAAVILSVFALVVFRMLPDGFRGRRMLNALNSGHSDLARIIVWLGTDPNYNTGHGTAMHYAAAKGDIDLMRFLVHNGAEVDVPGEGGLTPLHVARLRRDLAAERFLLAHGADPNVKFPQPH